MEAEVRKKIQRIYEQVLDIPVHKIKYLLNLNPDDNVNGFGNLLLGAFQTLKHYGYDLNLDAYEIFHEVISAKLEGTYEIEYEFNEREWEEMMRIKGKAAELDIKETFEL